MSGGNSFSFSNSDISGSHASIQQAGHDVNVSNNYGDSQPPPTPVQAIDAFEKTFNDAVAALPPAEVPAAAMTVEPPAETFAALRLLADNPEPPPAEVDSVIGRLKTMFTAYGPKLGVAVSRAAIAGLKATVVVGPAIDATIAFLETLNEQH